MEEGQPVNPWTGVRSADEQWLCRSQVWQSEMLWVKHTTEAAWARQLSHTCERVCLRDRALAE